MPTEGEVPEFGGLLSASIGQNLPLYGIESLPKFESTLGYHWPADP